LVVPRSIPTAFDIFSPFGLTRIKCLAKGVLTGANHDKALGESLQPIKHETLVTTTQV
jgi:hypothetical protein